MGTVSTNTWNLAYDRISQLLEASVRDSTTSALLKQFIYGYDQAGNRTREQIDMSVTTANHNALNQLTNTAGAGPVRFSGQLSEPGMVSVGGSAAPVSNGTNFVAFPSTLPGTNLVAVTATDYSNNSRTNTYEIIVTNGALTRTLRYDLNGNLETVVTATATNTYTWDAANRLLSITQRTGSNTLLVSEFTYDGLGRRARVVEKMDGVTNSDHCYLWVGTELAEERDATGATVTRRFFGQGEQIGGTNFFFTRDHLGSVRGMTDSTGAVRARYQYDPYGRRTKVAGDLEADFGFTGHYFNATSGLHLALFRAYDAESGRWLNRDPLSIRFDLNMYRLTYNNPINLIDRNGLWGVRFGGVQIGSGNPNLVFDSDSWNDLAQGAAATADGIIPFANPFQGYYDGCDPIFQVSRTLGEIGRDIALMAVIPNIGIWAKNPFLYEIGSTTVPADVYEVMQGLNAIQKGNYILSGYGLRGTLALNYEALKAGEFAKTIGTGITPGVSLLGLGVMQAADSASQKQCGF